MILNLFVTAGICGSVALVGWGAALTLSQLWAAPQPKLTYDPLLVSDRLVELFECGLN
jgi:hypothetical protein